MGLCPRSMTSGGAIALVHTSRRRSAGGGGRARAGCLCRGSSCASVLIRPVVKRVSKLSGGYSDIAASKRRKTLWWFSARGRKLIEQSIDGTAKQFANRPILFTGKRAESIHDWVGKDNLNLLHLFTIKPWLQWLQAAATPQSHPASAGGFYSTGTRHLAAASRPVCISRHSSLSPTTKSLGRKSGDTGYEHQPGCRAHPVTAPNPPTQIRATLIYLRRWKAAGASR